MDLTDWLGGRAWTWEKGEGGKSKEAVWCPEETQKWAPAVRTWERDTHQQSWQDQASGEIRDMWKALYAHTQNQINKWNKQKEPQSLPLVRRWSRSIFPIPSAEYNLKQIQKDSERLKKGGRLSEDLNIWGKTHQWVLWVFFLLYIPRFRSEEADNSENANGCKEQQKAPTKTCSLSSQQTKTGASW